MADRIPAGFEHLPDLPRRVTLLCPPTCFARSPASPGSRAAPAHLLREGGLQLDSPVMSTPADQDAYREVEARLLARWPETKLDPSLERIGALCDLLGSPQKAYPVVHLT